MSVRGFAAHLGVAVASVTNWERRGTRIRLRHETQEILDCDLSQAGDDVRDRFTAALDTDATTTAPVSRWGEARAPTVPWLDLSTLVEPKPLPANVDQRDVTQVRLAADLFVPSGNVHGGGLADAADPAQSPTPPVPSADSDEDAVDVLQRIHQLSRTVDPEIIRQLAVKVNDIVDRYEQFDHAEILPTLRQQRSRIEVLLDACNHAGQRQQLFEVAAGTSGLLGYLAVGRSRFQLARAYCAEAFTLGDLAQESNLQAWARGLQSFCEYYAQNYVEAVRFAEDGVMYANSGPQSARLMVNGIARAMGKLGDDDGVHRAVDTAYQMMTRNNPPEGIPSSVSFGCYSLAQAAGNAATAYVSLGAAKYAETFINQALPEVERFGSPWSRSLVMLDQATALASSQDGDLERASHLAIDAVAISTGRPIVAVRQRAMEFVLHATRQWGDAKPIRAIHDAIAGEAASS